MTADDVGIPFLPVKATETIQSKDNISIDVSLWDVNSWGEARTSNWVSWQKKKTIQQPQVKCMLSTRWVTNCLHGKITPVDCKNALKLQDVALLWCNCSCSGMKMGQYSTNTLLAWKCSLPYCSYTILLNSSTQSGRSYWTCF